jgi:hypothetical protein
MKNILLSLVLASLVFAGPAYSQIKVPPPRTSTVYSANQMFKAVTDKRLGKTTVFRHGEANGLWSVYGDVEALGVSNDGEYLVVGGGNYLPPGFTAELPILTVYKKGKPHRVLRISQIFSDYSVLQRTWEGFYRGFGNDGNYWLETVEKKQFGFDPATGRLSTR